MQLQSAWHTLGWKFLRQVFLVATFVFERCLFVIAACTCAAQPVRVTALALENNHIASHQISITYICVGKGGKHIFLYPSRIDKNLFLEGAVREGNGLGGSNYNHATKRNASHSYKGILQQMFKLYCTCKAQCALYSGNIIVHSFTIKSLSNWHYFHCTV